MPSNGTENGTGLLPERGIARRFHALRGRIRCRMASHPALMASLHTQGSAMKIRFNGWIITPRVIAAHPGSSYGLPVASRSAL